MAEAAGDEPVAAEAEAKPKPKPAPRRKAAAGPRIHVPDETIGRDGKADEAEVVEAVSENGADPAVAADADEAAPAKKRTRRGSRGGRNRKKKPAGETAASGNGSKPDEPAQAVPVEAESAHAEPVAAAEPSTDGDGASDWEYVPMSQWDDVDD